MKKLFYVAMPLMVFFSMVSCEKKNVNEPMAYEPVRAVNAELRHAAEVVAEMVGENAEYFSYIDGAVKDENLEYMEDRVLFRDLLSSDVETKSVSVLPFAKDFARLAGSGDAMTKSGGEQMDAEKLMAYLRDNNISIYCPFPLEDYAEDNRIPAICTIVSDNLDSLPGVQYHADGTFENVIVSQAYADEHPVWIIRHEDDYIFDSLNLRGNVNGEILEDDVRVPRANVGEVVYKPQVEHYETIVTSLYCSEFHGGVGEGELKIVLCFNSTEPAYSQEKKCFTTALNNLRATYVPRKNVRWAKQGYDKGWVHVGFSFSKDWTKQEFQKYMAAYEEDPRGSKTKKYIANLGYEGKGVDAGANVEVSVTVYEDDDIITCEPVPRDWFFEKVLKYGSATWYTDDKVTRKTALDGNYMMSAGSGLLLSVKCEKWYTPQTWNPGIEGGTVIKPGGTVVGNIH